MKDRKIFACDAGCLAWELDQTAEAADAILEAVTALDRDPDFREFIYETEAGSSAAALWRCLVLLAANHYEAADDLRDRAGVWAEQNEIKDA